MISRLLHTPEGEISVQIPMPGRHMVLNALAGAAVGALCALAALRLIRRWAGGDKDPVK